MAYEKKFVNPYPDGWIDLPEEETPVDAEAMQKITDGIEGIDNYLSENPPDELKESLIQFKDDGFLPKNLFDGTVNKGLWIVNNVVTSNASGQYVIVACEGGKTYTVSKKNLGLLWIASTVEYPAPNVNILDVQRGGSSNTKIATITTSSNAKYLLVEFGAGTTIEPSTYEELMIEESTEVTQYVPYAMSNTGLTQIVDDAIDGGYIQNKNLLNWNDLEEGKKFQSTTIINDSNWGIAYIPYRLGEPISISGYASVGLSGGIGFADANKNVIEVVQTQSVGGTYSTSNPNAKYFCASVVSNTTLGAYRHDMQIEYGSVSSYVERVPSNTELNQSLAQLVADLTPQNLSLTTESNVKQTYRLRAKKIGKEIVLNIYGTLNAITSDLTSWKPLFQMPQGMATSNHIDFALALGGAPYMVQAMVSNTGTIQFMPKQSLNEGTLFFINLVYVLD